MISTYQSPYGYKAKQSAFTVGAKANIIALINKYPLAKFK
jgi:hypothetical protein